MDEPLKAECEHFIDCVTNKKQPITDGSEGLRVLQVLQALQRSLNKKSRKVTIDQDALSLLKRKEFNSSGVSLGYENQENPFFIHESAYVDEGVNIVQVLRYGIFHISCPALRLVSNAA